MGNSLERTLAQFAPAAEKSLGDGQPMEDFRLCVRQRELATDYAFDFGFGISAVVGPRAALPVALGASLLFFEHAAQARTRAR